jgi:ribonucleoside-triphosphate reductase
MEGLGRGETAIFPIQIFRTKKGINLNKGDPNYDLFVMACECSAKRMFPNFSFQDAPFNMQFYNPNDPNTEIAYMGCRTRVISNVYDKQYEKSSGRGNLSFTSINLPRLAIEAVKRNPADPLGDFMRGLDNQMEAVARQLLERYQIQAQKKVYNFPFLMGQGIWHGSEKLGPTDTIGEIIKHGTLSIGFIGLAETLTALIGSHHGQSEDSQALGLEIIRRMRSYCDHKTKETGLNFTLIATPAEGLSGRFVSIDRQKYGIIEGVTDKDYYTNSFHVPVDYEITAFEKIKTEAPYHELTNAGHITYVELDGDPSANLEAFISIIQCMSESGVGYGAINHPIDRDPVCGYSGIIGNECPGCGRKEKDDVPQFERIRRITGYLVGDLGRFNNAKRAEEADRVKHG